ncbi:MAG TPA: sulfite exporter TauE/SafE family protein [Ohtaekwangia sp.]|uniref:sulfite exporter TauE/SafE family protein n=1 Tax=Ohtaekwangia sp. TaxID=2066019 RepID=UPI002F939B47
MIASGIVLFLCAFVAFCLSAVCGGGAGLLMMPVLGAVLPVTQVPAALSMGTVSSSASRIVVFRNRIRWDIVRWFVPTAIPAVFIGAWLLRFANPLYLEIIMGIFLAGNLPLLFKKKKNAEAVQKSSTSSLLVIGFLAGFLSGLTGAVGLLFNRFYLRHGLGKEEIVATRAANEMILHVIKVVLYASFGLMTGKVLVLGIIVALGGLISSWFMKWGLTWISENIFRKAGYASMVLSGIVMLSQSGSQILSQNNVNLSFSPIAGGIESQLQWQQANISIELEYDGGFEYEQEIPLSDLSSDQQQYIASQQGNANHVRIEEVFSINSHSYEAYYFNDDKLIKKIDFNSESGQSI